MLGINMAVSKQINYDLKEFYQEMIFILNHVSVWSFASDMCYIGLILIFRRLGKEPIATSLILVIFSLICNVACWQRATVQIVLIEMKENEDESCWIPFLEPFPGIKLKKLLIVMSLIHFISWRQPGVILDGLRSMMRDQFPPELATYKVRLNNFRSEGPHWLLCPYVCTHIHQFATRWFRSRAINHVFL